MLKFTYCGFFVVDQCLSPLYLYGSTEQWCWSLGVKPLLKFWLWWWIQFGIPVQFNCGDAVVLTLWDIILEVYGTQEKGTSESHDALSLFWPIRKDLYSPFRLSLGTRKPSLAVQHGILTWFAILSRKKRLWGGTSSPVGHLRALVGQMDSWLISTLGLSVLYL